MKPTHKRYNIFQKYMSLISLHETARYQAVLPLKIFAYNCHHHITVGDAHVVHTHKLRPMLYK